MSSDSDFKLLGPPKLERFVTAEAEESVPLLGQGKPLPPKPSLKRKASAKGLLGLKPVLEMERKPRQDGTEPIKAGHGYATFTKPEVLAQGQFDEQQQKQRAEEGLFKLYFQQFIAAFFALVIKVNVLTDYKSANNPPS